ATTASSKSAPEVKPRNQIPPEGAPYPREGLAESATNPSTRHFGETYSHAGALTNTAKRVKIDIFLYGFGFLSVVNTTANPGHSIHVLIGNPATRQRLEHLHFVIGRQEIDFDTRVLVHPITDLIIIIDPVRTGCIF